MPRLVPGQTFPAHTLLDIHKQEWSLPPDRLTHLQLRRFAGCPICNMHMIDMMGRQHDIEAAGIQELVVFNSTHDVLAAYAADLPFPMIPDPSGTLYTALGVMTSMSATLAPAAMTSALRGMLRPTALGTPQKLSSALLLPADFLIAPSGELLAVNYASHAAGQWMVDELIALATA